MIDDAPHTDGTGDTRAVGEITSLLRRITADRTVCEAMDGWQRSIRRMAVGPGPAIAVVAIVPDLPDTVLSRRVDLPDGAGLKAGRAAKFSSPASETIVTATASLPVRGPAGASGTGCAAAAVTGSLRWSSAQSSVM
ncbi:hypothetical protein [Methylobacterium frigidaeris]|uniref:hypothetical protein n=1 Tax=Methylobacterium frigidaeris TaxID=2038277 RepID=UPI003F68A8F0